MFIEIKCLNLIDHYISSQCVSMLLVSLFLPFLGKKSALMETEITHNSQGFLWDDNKIFGVRGAATYLRLAMKRQPAEVNQSLSHLISKFVIKGFLTERYIQVLCNCCTLCNICISAVFI